MLGELQKRPYDICHLLSRVSPLDSKITFSYKWLKSRAQLVTHRIFVSTIYLVETTLTEIRRDSKPKCIIHIQKWLDPFKQTKIPSDHFRVSLYVAGFSHSCFPSQFLGFGSIGLTTLVIWLASNSSLHLITCLTWAVYTFTLTRHV